MRCAKINYKLNDYLNNKLEASEKADVEKHLELCNDCRSEFGFLKKYNEKIDKLEIYDTSPYFLKKLNARIDKEESKNFLKKIIPIFPNLNFKYPVLAAGFALTLIIIIPALVFMFPHVKPENKVTLLKTESTAETLSENKRAFITTEKDEAAIIKKEVSGETLTANKSAGVSTQEDRTAIVKNEVIGKTLSANQTAAVSTEKSETAALDDKQIEAGLNRKGQLSLNSKKEASKIEIKKSKENFSEISIITLILETAGVTGSKIAMSKLSKSDEEETIPAESADSFKKSSSRSAVREESEEKIQSDEKQAESNEVKFINIENFNGNILSGSEESGEITVEIPLLNYQSFINMLKAKGKLSGSIPITSDLQDEKIRIKIEFKKM